MDGGWGGGGEVNRSISQSIAKNMWYQDYQLASRLSVQHPYSRSLRLFVHQIAGA